MSSYSASLFSSIFVFCIFDIRKLSKCFAEKEVIQNNMGKEPDEIMTPLFALKFVEKKCGD